MRKKLQTALLTGAILTAFTTPVTADEEAKFGAAVSFNDNKTEIRGIIELEDDLRLEPYFGFTYIDPDNTPSTTNYSLGTSLEFTKTLHANLNGYAGGFIGIDHQDTGTVSTTDFLLGPVAGVEYALDPHFTVGGEVRLTIGVGDNTILGTDSTILLRYYF